MLRSQITVFGLSPKGGASVNAPYVAKPEIQAKINKTTVKALCHSHFFAGIRFEFEFLR